MKRSYTALWVIFLSLVNNTQFSFSQTKGQFLNEKIEITSEILSFASKDISKSYDNDQDKKIKIESVRYKQSTNSYIIMSENFEGSFPSGDWNAYASSGYTDAYWDDQSYRYYNGSWSAWCADSGTDSPSTGENYPNNMRTWMVYGPFDLSDASVANLEFYYWNKSESNVDYFKWLASKNGTNYYGYQVSGNSNGWISKNFGLTNIPTIGDLRGEPQVWIAFLFTSDYSINYEGAYVDDIVLSKDVSPQNKCHPEIVYMEINGNQVNPNSTINVSLNNLNETFQVKLRVLNSSGNDGGSTSPALYNSVTLSFPEFTSSTYKSYVDLNTSTSNDLENTYGEYFGNEAQGGDAYAEYLMVEVSDDNDWIVGESNNFYIDVRPNNWGNFEIKYRVAMSNQSNWDDANFSRDPTSGLSDCLGFPSKKINVNVIQPPGTINISVKDQRGNYKNGVEVIRYNSSWQQIDSKYTDTNGKATWSDLPSGTTYHFSAYNPTPVVSYGEYWGSVENVAVNSGQTISKIVNRVMPFSYDINIFDVNDNSKTNFDLGETIKIVIYIENMDNQSHEVKVQCQSDRDKTGSMDFEQTSNYQSLAPSTCSWVTFNFTPIYAGDYYVRPKQTFTYTIGDQLTDSWEWPSNIYFSVKQPNHDPELSNGHVTPTSGNTNTDFAYYVTYKDIDGHTPSSILVNIDGSGGNYSHEMTYVSGSITSGAIYKYVTKLGLTPNPHQYYFWCTDGHGGTDQTNVQNGPTIEPNIVIVKDLIKNPNNPIEMINFEDILHTDGVEYVSCTKDEINNGTFSLVNIECIVLTNSSMKTIQQSLIQDKNLLIYEDSENIIDLPSGDYSYDPSSKTFLFPSTPSSNFEKQPFPIVIDVDWEHAGKNAATALGAEVIGALPGGEVASAAMIAKEFSEGNVLWGLNGIIGTVSGEIFYYSIPICMASLPVGGEACVITAAAGAVKAVSLTADIFRDAITIENVKTNDNNLNFNTNTRYLKYPMDGTINCYTYYIYDNELEYPVLRSDSPSICRQDFGFQLGGQEGHFTLDGNYLYNSGNLTMSPGGNNYQKTVLNNINQIMGPYFNESTKYTIDRDAKISLDLNDNSFEYNGNNQYTFIFSQQSEAFRSELEIGNNRLYSTGYSNDDFTIDNAGYLTKFISVNVTPSSPAEGNISESLILKISVGMEVGESGILQVLVDGLTHDYIKYKKVDGYQSTIVSLEIEIDESQTGLEKYDLHIQYRPGAQVGPLNTTNLYDIIEVIWDYHINWTPVELTSFTVTLKGKAAILDWQTAAEKNNYGFDIQRSKLQNLNSQELIQKKWEKIGFVRGKGTTNTPNHYTFLDNKLSEPGKYYYRLKQIDFDGGFEYSQEIEFILEAPTAFKLSQNYPNPFNQQTTIYYAVPKTSSDAHLTLCVYNLQGQLIRTLVDENSPTGVHNVKWDGTDNENRPLPTGIYFYRMNTDKYIITKRMVLLR